MGQAGGGAYETLDDRLLLRLLLMPLLLGVDDVVARGDMLMDPIEDALEDLLVEALDDPDEVLAPVTGELEDPDEMLTPGTCELEARVLGTCDVDE